MFQELKWTAEYPPVGDYEIRRFASVPGFNKDAFYLDDAAAQKIGLKKNRLVPQAMIMTFIMAATTREFRRSMHREFHQLKFTGGLLLGVPLRVLCWEVRQEEERTSRKIIDFFAYYLNAQKETSVAEGRCEIWLLPDGRK